MKTLKLKKDVVERLTSTQARNAKGGHQCTNDVCHPMSYHVPGGCILQPYTEICVKSDQQAACVITQADQAESVCVCVATYPCAELG